MTRRPHDALLKWALEDPAAAAALLRSVLPPALRDAIAWATLRLEPGSYIDRALADRHNDLLFCARLQSGEPRHVFLLIEHQSTGDADLPRRVHAYQARIWDRFRRVHPAAPLPLVVGVLVSHVPGGWTDARSFDELFDPAVLALPGVAALVPRFSLVVLDLAHLSDADLAGRGLAAPQRLALWLLRDARDPARLLAAFDAWIPAFVEAGQGRSGLDTLHVLLEYMFGVVDGVTRDALRAKLHALGASTEEIAMTIAELYQAEGHEKGLAKGRVDTLRRLLVQKFGALDAAAEAQLQAATGEAVDRYLGRLLAADSLAVVLAD
jgi:hypothetical protein